MTKIQLVRSRILKVRSAILKLWSTILEPIFYQFCFNLCLKLRTAILKLRTVIIDDWSTNLCFESGYSLELRDFYTPSSQISLNTLKNWSQAIRRGEYHWRRDWRRRTQEPGEKSKIFLVYSFFYSFLMLCCCLNINLCVISVIICG
jgi:hypothetical protein